jgi:hypothetical protein
MIAISRPQPDLPGSIARIGKTYDASPDHLAAWKAQGHDAQLARQGLITGAGSGGGIALDAFTNAAARNGFGTASVAEGAEYELVRWTYNYWLMITLYRNQWVARNIVDIPAQDMIRAWPKLTSDIEPKDLTQIDRCIRVTQTKSKLLETLKWARLFGGAGALIQIDGHENRLDEPLDYDTIELGAYRGLIPFDRWVGIYPDGALCNDITRPVDYNLPEHYRVQTPSGGGTFTVHSSRILRFTGPSVPYPEYQAQMYWGISVLEIAYEAMKMRDNMLWNMLGLSFRANLLSFQFGELAQALSGASMNQQALVSFYQRLEAMNSLLSNQNMLVLPEGQSLQSSQYQFGGCSDLLEQFRFEVSGASGVPEMRLFGHSPSGLGIKDDPAERLYEERIAVEQDDKLRPQLEKLYPVMCMSTLGEIPDDLDLNFPSIRVPGEDEKADLTTKVTASIVSLYGAGLISKKIALQELKQSSTSTNFGTNVTDKDIKAAEKDDADAKKLQEAQQEAMLAGGLGPAGASGSEGETETPAGEAENEPAPRKPKQAADSEHRDLTFAGLPITIEYDAGTRRQIRNEAGQLVYDRLMRFDYGFIRNTLGRDGDEVDVLIGPAENAPFVYVCDMIDLGPDIDKRENESKVCLGFQSRSSAERAFLTMYPPSFLGGIEELTLAEFVEQLNEVDGSMLALDEIGFVGDDFVESEHPRGRGEHGGEFVEKGSGESTTSGKSASGAKSSSGSQAKGSAALEPAPKDRAQWPAHIRALKPPIPPAWTDVRINPDPNGDLLASGRDIKGRLQPRYSAEFSKRQSEEKFKRVHDLARKFEQVKKENDALMRSKDEKVRQNAECTALIMKTGIRPGSETDTGADKKAFGATTLQGKHVVKDGGQVYLRFTGKKGVALNLPVEDKALASDLMNKATQAGPSGQLFPQVSAGSLLQHVHSLDGGKFKSKDLRTLLGTKTALEAVKEVAPPTNETEYKKQVRKIADIVARKLGNTPVIALQSYISPEVFAGWKEALSA